MSRKFKRKRRPKDERVKAWETLLNNAATVAGNAAKVEFIPGILAELGEARSTAFKAIREAEAAKKERDSLAEERLSLDVRITQLEKDLKEAQGAPHLQTVIENLKKKNAALAEATKGDVIENVKKICAGHVTCFNCEYQRGYSQGCAFAELPVHWNKTKTQETTNEEKED